MEYVVEEKSDKHFGEDLDTLFQGIADERGVDAKKMLKDMDHDEFELIMSVYTYERNKQNMSIDPNKAFGMKATNSAYTLEFSRDSSTGITRVTAVDMESPKMTFSQRLKVAIAILFGKANIGDLVFPLSLRNSDFYHMSYIYRPEKKVEVKAVPPTESEVPAKPKAKKPGRPKTKKPKDTPVA
jgi:hypothetical protein